MAQLGSQAWIMGENGGKTKLNQCLLGWAVLRQGKTGVGAKAEPPVTFRTGIGVVLPVEGEILEQPAQGWASLSKGHKQAGLKEPVENIPSPERLCNNFHIP